MERAAEERLQSEVERLEDEAVAEELAVQEDLRQRQVTTKQQNGPSFIPSFLQLLNMMIILPRQARDKHRESKHSQKGEKHRLFSLCIRWSGRRPRSNASPMRLRQRARRPRCSWLRCVRRRSRGMRSWWRSTRCDEKAHCRFCDNAMFCTKNDRLTKTGSGQT
jgi:hypothetical protein|eukprot:COSAG06_NODE_8583_length_2124_cov_2647.899704_3_plen_164_part_00